MVIRFPKSKIIRALLSIIILIIGILPTYLLIDGDIDSVAQTKLGLFTICMLFIVLVAVVLNAFEINRNITTPATDKKIAEAFIKYRTMIIKLLWLVIFISASWIVIDILRMI